MRDIQTDGTPIAAAAPAKTVSNRRRVIFMVPDWPENACIGKGVAQHQGSRNRHLLRRFLTFGAHGALTAAILGKTFFSTRRPALEAGGQRPTARCALGRKSVLSIRPGDDGYLLPRPALAGRGS